MKHTLVFHLLGVSKKLQKALGYKSQPLSLSFSQARALLIISSFPHFNQKEIAWHLQLEPASVVTLIDELEKLKLANRQSIENNRRTYKIELTGKGKSYAAEIKKHSYDVENLINKALKPAETDKFFNMLEKLNSEIDKWQDSSKNPIEKEVNHELPSAKRYLAS